MEKEQRKKGLRSISGVDAPSGPLNWMSGTGFLPAKVPRHLNLQQALPLSFPIKHWGSVVVQADPRRKQQTKGGGGGVVKRWDSNLTIRINVKGAVDTSSKQETHYNKVKPQVQVEVTEEPPLLNVWFVVQSYSLFRAGSIQIYF